MKDRLKWLLPAFFLVLGTLFYFFVGGHSFLGIIFWGIALLTAVYRVLAQWEKSSRMPAKVVRTIVTVFLIIGLVAAGITLVPILRGPGGETGTECQYVMVLGAGVQGETPSRILQDRINEAYEYLTAHPDAVCIASGGKGDGENISEAQCIFDRLTAMGIDPERIWMENRSTTTVENFKFTLELIEEQTGSRPTRIGVISNEFHLYRASLIAQRSGVEIQAIPAATSWASLRLNYTLREIFALWKFLILGG